MSTTLKIRDFSVESDNSHLAYNTHIDDTDYRAVEYARFGSVLVNHGLAIAAISATISAKPKTALKTAGDIQTAINHGLRLISQRAFRNAIKNPGKHANTAATAIANHAPLLVPETPETPANNG